MNIPVKKITSLLFLLLGMLPLLFILSFHIQRYLVRQHMKEKLESENLQTIILPEKDVIWMDKREIWVDEHMFDIHSVTLENGVYTFTGLFDEQETLLVKQHNDVTGKSKEENQLLARILECFQNIYFDPPYEIPGFTRGQNLWPPQVSAQAVKPFRVILTPPPQSLS